ncbi:hypothetical protein Tco_0474717, partial [Tanacetum coccineum]
VMAAPIIFISLDSSEESAGNHAPRVILFGDIPAIIPVIPKVSIVPVDSLAAPEVGAVSVTSPTEVLDLVDYLFFASDPSEDSLPPAPAPDLPLVSPFLCSDDSEADSRGTWSHLFPFALVVAPPGIRRRPVILIRPDEAIPFGRPYHTHLNGPHFTSDSSSSGSSSDSSDLSSSGSPSDSLLDTSSVHSSGKAFRRWRSAPLSTPYPPTTLESSLDSSFERSLDSSSLSVGPSRKRCISFITSVPSSTSVSRPIAPTHADLLPPHKRFREDEEEFEAEASAVGTREIAIDLLVAGGISESTIGDVPDLEDTIYDIVHYMSEVPLDRITEFETAQRQLEASQLIASGERAGLTDTIRRLGRENLRLIAQRVAEALANYEATRAANALKAEIQSQNGSDDYNGNGGNGNGGNTNSGNGNGNHGDGGNNGNGNLNENGRGVMQVDFVKCQQLNFKGTKGVVGLTRWFEKMETVFHISNCLERSYEVDDGSVLSKERDTENGN